MRIRSEKPARNGGHIHRLREPSGNGRAPQRPRPASTISAWNKESERCTAAIPADRLAPLAAQLGVTVSALQSIGIGWAESADLERWRAGFGDGGRPDGAYVFPERDGAGRIIGLALRAPDGRKGSASGAKRGLVIPSGFHAKPDPVLIVEGASDTAACIVLGLSAIGRPSNSGGGELLAALLDGRDILVVGENDAKESGAWPGRDGAKAIAKRLAAERGAKVQWALPPAESKDVRSWLQSRIAGGLNLADPQACNAAGAELLAALESAAREARPGRKQSQADRLAELAADAELWHTPDGDAFATVPAGTHVETHRVRSKVFRQWLAGCAYRDGGSVPNAEAIQATLAVIEARAIFEGPEQPAPVRVAEHEGEIWLDLADSEWRAVRVNVDGWRIVENPPVRFRRPRGMRPLPTPERGGDIRELGKIVNVDADGLALVGGYLLGALNPRGPYPALAIHGPQGSGKSCAARMLKNIIDPSEPATRTVPGDERDLCIAAENGWIVSFDNLSGIPVWLSDSLCRLATGGGLATRELFTDRDETIFSATRPAILNGIEDVASRPDLLDRCIILNLEAFRESAKRTESELSKEFATLHPRLLGVLLDAASAALRNLPNTRLEARPRLLDFATWVVAGESALGLAPGEFLRAYMVNRSDANSIAIESCPVALTLLDSLECGPWTGTPTELLAALDGRVSDAARKVRTWPKSARALTGILRRVSPNLEAVGVALEIYRKPGGNRERIIRAEKTPDSSSRPSRPSRKPPDGPENADSAGTMRDDAGRNGTQTGTEWDANENGLASRENGLGDTESPIRDDRDGRDDEIPPNSGGIDPPEDDPFERAKRAVGIDPAAARGAA